MGNTCSSDASSDGGGKPRRGEHSSSTSARRRPSAKKQPDHSGGRDAGAAYRCDDTTTPQPGHVMCPFRGCPPHQQHCAAVDQSCSDGRVGSGSTWLPTDAATSLPTESLTAPDDTSCPDPQPTTVAATVRKQRVVRLSQEAIDHADQRMRQRAATIPSTQPRRAAPALAHGGVHCPVPMAQADQWLAKQLHEQRKQDPSVLNEPAVIRGTKATGYQPDAAVRLLDSPSLSRDNTPSIAATTRRTDIAHCQPGTAVLGNGDADDGLQLWQSMPAFEEENED